MSAPDLDIGYVAKLARIQLSDAEVATFSAQLGQVLEYVEQLNSVDVDGVEPMAHPNTVYNILRPDQPGESLSAEDALANAPRQANGLFIVPKVIE